MIDIRYKERVLAVCVGAIAIAFSDDFKGDQHDEDEDVGAVKWDDHMQGVLDVVSSPFGLFDAVFNHCDRLARFVFERATAAPEVRLLIALARLHIFLLSDELTVHSDLRTFVLKLLRLELVHHQSLGQERVSNLGSHVFKVDQDWHHVDDQVAANCAHNTQ